MTRRGPWGVRWGEDQGSRPEGREGGILHDPTYYLVAGAKTAKTGPSSYIRFSHFGYSLTMG